MPSDRLGVGGSVPHEVGSPDATRASGSSGAPEPFLSDDDLPTLFRNADFTSVSAQAQYFRATRLRLALLVAAAVAAAGAVEGLKPNWFSFAGGVLLIIAATVELYLLRDQPDRRWYEGRAAAESAKTLGWRYAVGGAPFALGAMPEREADRLLVQRLEDSLTDLGDLSFDRRHGAGQQITPRMRDLRASPLDQRKAIYESDRIQDQLNWYGDKSTRHERQARRLTLGVLAFELVGAAGGLYFAVRPLEVFDNVVAVAATAAAALGVWLQAKQHQTLARVYAVAAQELSSIRSLIRWRETEEDWSRFVEDAESAISREHTLWRANRGLRHLRRDA
jgi:conflict system pore-forming effector with SLATT domain